MRALPIEVLKDIERDDDLVVGRKYDGFSELFIVQDGIARLFNRSGREHTLNVPSLTARKLSVPDFKIQGEAVGPLPGINSVKSILGSKPERAIKYQEEYGALKLLVHNLVSYRGEDLARVPFGEKRRLLLELVAALKLGNGLESVFVESLRTVGKYDFFQEVVADGGEGVVVKKLSGFESDWFKCKRQRTWDVIITGFTEAKPGKFGGLIGAVRFGAFDDNGNLVEVGRCSGMVDEQRMAFTIAQESYIGKVMEVEGQEISSHGRIRFPRFVRLREDKPPTECLLRDLQTDARY